MCLLWVLFCSNQSSAYLFFLENEMLDFMTLVFKNEVFLSSILIYIIFSRCRKSAHTILNVVSIFSLLKSINLFLVIFSRMSFIIGKRMTFYFRKSLFLPLIISAIQDMSKISKLNWQSM